MASPNGFTTRERESKFIPETMGHDRQNFHPSLPRRRRAEPGCVTSRQPGLCSDQSGFEHPWLATITDADLANPWGVSHSPTSPFWVSNQGTNTATLYAVTGATNVTKVNINAPAGFVAIPTTSKGPQGPTGQVNNANASSFPVKNGGDGGSAHFIFADLNGTISAWDKGSTAFIQVTTPGAVYTGLATNGAQTRLYAANDAGGSIGSPDVLYFADGINGEKDGLFGAISANREARHECRDCDRDDDDHQEP